MLSLSSTSLRTRLLLLVVLAVIPAFVLIGSTAIAQREQAARDAEAKALRLVHTAASEQVRLIATTRQLLLTLSHLPAVRDPGAAAACSRILAELRQPHPYYTNFGVATPDGRVFCSALPMSRPISIADRSYFQRSLRSRDLGIGDYQIGRITGIHAINFGYPIVDAGGNIQAVVYAALNLSWLNQVIAGVDLPTGSSLTVVDSRGTILARHPEPKRWVGKSMLESPLLKAILARKDEGTAELAGPDGVTRLYAFAPLQNTSSGDVYVSVGIPKAVAFAAAKKKFTRDLALLLLIATLALVAAWVGSDVFVLRRVNALASAARRLAQGDLRARTGLPHGGGELGQLARTFDDMAASLQRSNRALMALSAGNRTLVRAVGEQGLLQDMCKVIVEVGGYRLAWVGYAEQNQQKTVRAMAQAGLAEEDFAGLMKALKVTWADEERGWGPIGTAIRTGKPYVARNILTDPNFAPFREEAQKRGYASVAAFSLHVDGRAIGGLAICHAEADAFDKKELKLLADMAEDLAYGIATLRTRVAHKEATEVIEHLAYHDTLTGLPNHMQLQERLRQSLHDAEAQNRSFALLLLGLNRFRQVNETLGFEHGNVVLKEIGPRIRTAVQDTDFLARMRGDEFAVLLPGSGAEQAVRTARQILQALEEPFLVGGLLLEVQARVGVVLFPGHGKDVSDLIRRADVALHQAKRSGSEYSLYAAEKDQESPRRLALAGSLRRAIENDQLVLHYQPKIDMQAGYVCGAEALVRWQHPKDGMIPPGEFIGIAENTGLIKPLTSWVLEAALRQSYAWRQQAIDIPIAVNLSVRNLRDPKLVESIKGLLATWSIEPGDLELEITESALMEDPAGALEVLTGLRAMGIKLSIDDFGTGYSSLGYLNKLPVDELKIDRSFVMDMTVNNDSAIIVRSTIDLAHDLGIKVVAEGVENQAVWEALAALHCDVAQGYHMGKPMPAEAYKDWLSQSPWTLEQRKVG